LKCRCYRNTSGKRRYYINPGDAPKSKRYKAIFRGGNNNPVLDEPSTGLHPSDTKKLLHHLDDLVTNGNTLIVIEHNLDIIAHADWIIDIGPGAGKFEVKLYLKVYRKICSKIKPLQLGNPSKFIWVFKPLYKLFARII
jgi:hypothetical protein